MNANDPNVALLEIVAERLGDDLRGEMVFVGGAVAGVFITGPATPMIRATEDVDLVCRAVALTEYHQIKTALRTWLAGTCTLHENPASTRVNEVAAWAPPTHRASQTLR